jgi:hypothetical protein
MKRRYDGKIMTANDMFRQGAKQIFDLKTGDWLRTIMPHDKLIEKPEELPEPEEQFKDVNQLSLF